MFPVPIAGPQSLHHMALSLQFSQVMASDPWAAMGMLPTFPLGWAVLRLSSFSLPHRAAHPRCHLLRFSSLMRMFLGDLTELVESHVG